MHINKHADEQKKRGYYALLKAQIEDMYNQSNKTKVSLLVHSMGGPTTLYFLDPKNGIVTQDWKDTYLHAYITLSAAWAGSPKTLEVQISGGGEFDLGEKIQEIIRSISRTLQSVYWMFPNPDVFKGVLVRTPSKTYNASQYENLLDNIDLPMGYTKYMRVEDLIKGFPAPGVRTYCYWGVDTPTPSSYNYSDDFPKGAGEDPKRGYSDGDGTVNSIASEVCLRWTKDLAQNMTFPNVKHVDMVKNMTVLETIAKVVVNIAGSSGPRSHPKVSDDNHMEGLLDSMTPVGSRPRSHPKVSDDNHMEGLLDSMTPHTLRAYDEIQKAIGKMLKKARVNNFY